MKAYSKKNQHGRSMIEMLGVLAIVGVLSAGGIAGYSMAMQSYKTNQLIERIQLIATRARQLYKGDYNNVSIDDLINAGKISDSDRQNPFGGTLGLTKTGTWEPGSLFVVTFTNVPAETCTDLLLTNWGDRGVFEGVDGIKVTSGKANLRYNDGTWPISDAGAINYCKNAPTFYLVFR